MDVFSSLVEEQKAKSDVVQLFGVILYTDENPHIKKALRDDDYWLALDGVTGKNFAVFSVRPEKGRYEFPRFPPGFTGMMVKLWKEPADNKKLIDFFGLESTERLPLLLLFTEVNGEYLSIQFRIDDSNEVNAYQSTRSHLEFACGVISKIRKENYSDGAGLFAALSLQNDQRTFWKSIKNGVKIFSYLKGLVS